MEAYISLLAQVDLGLPDTLMDVGQLVAWGAGIAAVIVTGLKAIKELRHATDVREEELRWKRADLARQMTTEIDADPKVQQVKTMIDFAERNYDIPGFDDPVPLTDTIINHAMRANNLNFVDDPPEEYIRNCFDALFDGFEGLERGIRAGFIVFDDVQHKYSYWVRRMGRRQDVIDQYVQTFDPLAHAFMQRFA